MIYLQQSVQASKKLLQREQKLQTKANSEFY